MRGARTIAAAVDVSDDLGRSVSSASLILYADLDAEVMLRPTEPELHRLHYVETNPADKVARHTHGVYEFLAS